LEVQTGGKPGNGGLVFHGFNGFIADLKLDDVVLS